ncbi:FAD-dependent oxidoreductase [Ruminococcus flavefaciens]|uniref:FAD-dependent oxidoreductase n=1 Tax=Ruminococcus flavefaciens TaxID=1265 RepID=UPI0026EBA74F|nr:FAD-dependent oxidoreductase [Ruminococcus flavefaciens]MDD7515257.1 FAD-dependent oxidoreductase [Ruminococcus flavefaciens]MDY5692966.1 FAD-dependent oxidoreductase [Ruminococcus flavefaciens]
MEHYDKIIIGAGFYGLYSALFCCRRGERILVLEADEKPFMRATHINQARVHNGYHYPRSLSTAMRSASYFEKFNNDFGFCVNREFEQIYATSSLFSWTDAEQFIKFCRSLGIPCNEIHPNSIFKENICDGAFRTVEYSYDAIMLRDHLLELLNGFDNAVTIKCSSAVVRVERSCDSYHVITSDGYVAEAPFLLNSSYASVNQIINLAGEEEFRIKYELCELILCDVSPQFKNTGVTVMDGPFFSIMPFGKTECHSLTSVTFTPHSTCYEPLPGFSCQAESGGKCSPSQLYNCNCCNAAPKSAYPYMSRLARKYLRDDYSFEYRNSIYSMKPILMASEIDDSRPTVIKIHSQSPTFVSVLSGKINTVYDLDEVLING